MLPYKKVLRPLLFSLPSEQAHRLGELVLKQRAMWGLLSPYYRTSDPTLRTTLAGINVSSPVGVAAGCDKNCQFLPSLLSLGFGYVVGGTVTLGPKSGNPSPRILRDAREGSLVNAMGFPNLGSEAVLKSLEKRPVRPLILSVSGLTVEEFVDTARRLEPHAQGLELNISSPNTAGLKSFHDPQALGRLLEAVNAVRRKPLFVKLPPYSPQMSREKMIVLAAAAQKAGVDGITAANTRPVQESRLKVGSGGLSGMPLLVNTLNMVEDLRREMGEDIVINACGGISRVQDALQALERGADTVQIYTALIFEGPGVARSINRGLSRILKERGLTSVRDLRKVRPG